MAIQFVVGKAPSVAFHSPNYSAIGLNISCTMAISGHGIVASQTFETPPYGMDLCEFFEELASAQSTWVGRKTWGSMEGELAVSATCDSVGHVSIEFNVNPDPVSVGWSATAVVQLGLGELPEIARGAKAFWHNAS